MMTLINAMTDAQKNIVAEMLVGLSVVSLWWAIDWDNDFEE